MKPRVWNRQRQRRPSFITLYPTWLVWHQVFEEGGTDVLAGVDWFVFTCVWVLSTHTWEKRTLFPLTTHDCCWCRRSKSEADWKCEQDNPQLVNARATFSSVYMQTTFHATTSGIVSRNPRDASSVHAIAPSWNSFDHRQTAGDCIQSVKFNAVVQIFEIGNLVAWIYSVEHLSKLWQTNRNLSFAKHSGKAEKSRRFFSARNAVCFTITE